ncbi:hypothetical protein Q9L58_001935 [Maublancomyces gigas]|uniref:Uncharacterized protein n=1 Tax=Discina gigas TaxID=1032678 RepID=A0ABR3GTA4_9PEZI
MLRGRPLPTIVIEVGYSESLPRSRLDAHRWLTKAGVSEEGEERKRKRDGAENGVGVMLVMLISYEGKRPSEDHGIAYSSVDEVNEAEAGETGTDPESAEHGLSPNQKQLKPLSIWVEMWRLQPAPLAPATRANPNMPDPATLQPHLNERKQFFPSTADDSVTILLQDVFGAEKVRNPGNAVKWNLPFSVFRKAYEERLEIFMAQIAGELGELEEGEEVLEAGPEDVDVNDTEAEVFVGGVDNDTGGTRTAKGSGPGLIRSKTVS